MTWQAKDGTTYKDDNGATVREEPDYKWQYCFYSSANGYVTGDYQCTVTYANRTYAIRDVHVTAAKFTMNVEKPANASVAVYVDDSPTAESDNSEIEVRQTQKVRVVVTPNAAYAAATPPPTTSVNN